MSEAKAEKIFVFETWAERTVQGWGQVAHALHCSLWDWPDGEPAVDLHGESFDLLSTEESRPVVDSLERDGLSVVTLPRAEALHWAVRDQTDPGPCLVLSVGPETGWAWLIRDGRVASAPWSGPELSVRRLLKASLESHPRRFRLFEAYREQSDANFEDSVQAAALEALETGRATRAGPLTFVPPLDLSAGASLIEVPVRALDSGRLCRSLVLTDWGARHCNLGDCLRERWKDVYHVVHPPAEDAPFQALRGLSQYHARLLRQLPPPRLEVSPARLDFGKLTGDEPATATLRVKNSGGAETVVEISSRQPWLAPVPARLTCGAGQGHEVAVGLDPSQLKAGQRAETSLEVRWDSPEGRQSLSVPVAGEKAAAAVLVCPSADCPNWTIEEGDACPACRSAPVAASLDVLRNKAAAALEKDWESFPARIPDWAGWASGAGLPATESRRTLDGLFKSKLGCSVQQGRAWLQERDRLSASGAAASEARATLLAMADSIGLSERAAERVLSRAWPVVVQKPAPPEPVVKKQSEKKEVAKRSAAGWWLATAAVLVAGGFLIEALWPPACPEGSLGGLVVHVSPPAKTFLDGFYVPSGGQRISEVHEFPALKPGTHEVRAFRDGYLAESRKVTIEPCVTAEAHILLRPR